jgi:hypothetical protein
VQGERQTFADRHASKAACFRGGRRFPVPIRPAPGDIDVAITLIIDIYVG